MSPEITREALERNPQPMKSIKDTEFDSYCLLEEIGSTNQWVQCKVHAKKGDVYAVELQTKLGYQILKGREDLLLSKVQMQKYEPELFEI